MIASDLSLTCQSSAEGYAVGQIISSSISGKVRFSALPPCRNSRIYLYYRTRNRLDDEWAEWSNWIIVGNWFLSDYSINPDTGIMSFNGQDSVSYLNNNYEPPTGKYITPVNHAAAIEQMLSTLSQTDITLAYPGSIKYDMSNSTTTDAMSVMRNIALYMATNYAQPLKTEDAKIEYLQCGEEVYYVSPSDRSELTYTGDPQKVSGVRVYTHDTILPQLGEFETYEDYGIYTYGDVAIGNMATVIEVQSPYTSKTDTQLGQIVGQDLSVTFNCTVKMKDIIHCLSKIVFDDHKTLTCYATSIRYTFKSDGIYANISGQGRRVSDYEYVGTTAKELKKCLKFNGNYGGITIDYQSGLYFVENDKSSLTRTADDEPKKYGFEVNSGGFVNSESVISSKKPAEKVTVNKTAGTVTVNYTDGHKYTYSAGVTETADGYEITEESEEWE